MKKNFPLRVPGKADARVIEAIKHDVHKYVKRERKKTLPNGFTAWEFDCRVGSSPEAADITSLAEITRGIDTVASAGGDEVYVEILARPGHRLKTPSVSRPAPA